MPHYILLSRADGARQKVDIRPGLTLAQSLFLAGAFSGRPLCSGLGRCGLCQVRFVSNAPPPLPEEGKRLPPGRLDEGWRLSCLRPPVADAVVEARLDDESGFSVAAASGPPGGAQSLAVLPHAPDLRSDAPVLGVDLGTTSMQWRLVRAEANGAASVLAEGQGRNPQMGAGSDVMARLALAALPGGAQRLRSVVLNAIARVVDALPRAPSRLCVAGNSVMTCLALGLDTSGLAGAPYRLPWNGGAFVSLYNIVAPVYLPPLLAPFVGGDISAGLAALEFGGARPGAPFLLADLGTNGEFALTLADGRVLVASVPMGPALEGVGMRQGVLAGPGAVVGFSLGPAGLVPRLYAAGAGQPSGVAAAGYLSLLAMLRQVGALEADGRFPEAASTPLAGRVLRGLTQNDGQPCLDAGGVRLWAADVESLLKVKAAFGAAVSLLLERAGLRFSDLSAVRLAGALGEHIRLEDLETLGFLPPGALAVTRSVGNTSLHGACLAASRADVREWLAALPGRCRVVELVDAPGFQKRYLDAMRFEHV
ncbi:ASKHA domain-containing protein [Fundidesulfovibrio butyratiphilus]